MINFYILFIHFNHQEYFIFNFKRNIYIFNPYLPVHTNKVLNVKHLYVLLSLKLESLNQILIYFLIIH